MNENVLKVDNISLKIKNGPTLIVPDGSTSLEIKSGEVVLLLGVNGSGKTTLVESLFGQGFRANSVEFSCDKEFCDKPYNVNEIKSKIGYSENELDSSNNCHTFFGSLKVLTSGYENGYDKNYAEGLYNLFCENEQVQKTRIPLKYRMLGKCSGGQRKKFAILKALCRKDAKLYIFDEPVNCLDTKTMIKFRDFIESHRGKDSAFLIITHCKIFNNPDKVYCIDDAHLIDVTSKYVQADCLNAKY